MANINLLPWREERRQLIKKQFLIILGASVAVAALLIMLTMSIFNSAISGQEGRNQYLQSHIKRIFNHIDRHSGMGVILPQFKSRDMLNPC